MSEKPLAEALAVVYVDSVADIYGTPPWDELSPNVQNKVLMGMVEVVRTLRYFESHKMVVLRDPVRRGSRVDLPQEHTDELDPTLTQGEYKQLEERKKLEKKFADIKRAPIEVQTIIQPVEGEPDMPGYMVCEGCGKKTAVRDGHCTICPCGYSGSCGG